MEVEFFVKCAGNKGPYFEGYAGEHVSDYEGCMQLRGASLTFFSQPTLIHRVAGAYPSIYVYSWHF
jgi:hypothetical protein